MRAGGRVHRQRAVLTDEPVHADSIALVSSAASTPASFSSATNSLCRSVRAVSASSPDTGTTAWQMPVLSISVVNRVGDILGRQHRVDPARTDLVGTRRHPDHAQRTRRPADQFADLLEQRDIGGVEGAQQEHHGIDARHAVIGHQQPQGALGDVPRQ